MYTIISLMAERKPSVDIDKWVRGKWNGFLDSLFTKLPENLDPNIITVAGGMAGALSALSLAHGNLNIARGTYALAAFLDAFDGYVARRLNGKGTPLGECLDSILDRGVDWATLWAMEHYADKQNWTLAANMAQLARPLVAAPAILRAVAEEHDIGISKLDVGSRLARSVATTYCLAFPSKKSWEIGLGYIAAASGVTTLQRFQSISEDPAALESAWNLFDSVGEQFMLGVHPDVVTIGMIARYAEMKAQLVTRAPVTEHNRADILSLSPVEQIGQYVSMVIASLNRVGEFQNGK